MKRTLVIGLAAALLLSVMLVGAVPVSAEKNQCETFEILRSYLLEFNTSGTPKTEFTASDMGYWVRQQYDSVYSDRLQGEWENGVFTASADGLYTAYPAAHFESIAHRGNRHHRECGGQDRNSRADPLFPVCAVQYPRCRRWRQHPAYGRECAPCGSDCSGSADCRRDLYSYRDKETPP